MGRMLSTDHYTDDSHLFVYGFDSNANLFQFKVHINVIFQRKCIA